MGLERNNLLRPVHNRTVGLDRSSDDIIVVLELDDNYFGGFTLLFSYTDERVGFECLRRRSAQVGDISFLGRSYASVEAN